MKITRIALGDFFSQITVKMHMIPNKKAKVLFLGPTPPPFMGPSVATEIILNSSLKEHFTLIPLDTSDRRDLKYLGKIDIGNITLALRHYILLISKLIRFRPEIVYIPISQTTVGYLRDTGFIILSKLFARKVICHLRGGYFRSWLDNSSKFTRFFVKRIHGLVNAQIVLGECLVPLFTSVMDANRIYVVPNGRDFDESKFLVEKEDVITVLFLATFEKSKGVLDFLHSLPLVDTKSKNVKFVLAGSWHKEDVRKAILDFIDKNLELPIDVISPVNEDNKYQIFGDADIFVFPTFYPPEGHPWVIVEALAAGLPIITTDQGAIKESVFEGINGFLTLKQSPMEIAIRITQLLNDDSCRRQMGSNSRRIYCEKFTEAKLVENLTHCFREVLKAS